MDLLWSLLPAVILVLVIFRHFRRKNCQYKSFFSLPGPKSLPLIGERQNLIFVSKKKLFRREGSGWIGQIKHTVKVVRSTPERERGQRNDLKVWYLVHWSTQQLEESHPLLPNTLTLGKGNEEWNSSTVTRSGRHRPNTRRRNRDSSHPRHGYSRHRRSRVAENGVTLRE